MPFRFLRVFTCALALSLIAPACARFERHQDPASGSKPSQAYGSGLATEDAARPSARSERATLRVRVLDAASSRPLPGAIVRAKHGRTQRSAPTDAGGVARLRVPAGNHSVRVAGCGTTVVVDRASEAGARVPAGETLDVTLLAHDWKRRYVPSASVFQSRKPPWRIGGDVRLRVLIEDVCEHDASPGASIAAYRWRHSANIRIVGDRPARAASDGYAPITIECVARGNASLVMHDPDRKAEPVDVVQAGSGPPDGHTTCE